MPLHELAGTCARCTDVDRSLKMCGRVENYHMRENDDSAPSNGRAAWRTVGVVLPVVMLLAIAVVAFAIYRDITRWRRGSDPAQMQVRALFHLTMPYAA